jgi:hypothetical protein
MDSRQSSPDDDDDDVYLNKNYNERVSQNLYSIRFHIDKPKRHKCKKISMIIRNKGSSPTRVPLNDNPLKDDCRHINSLPV